MSDDLGFADASIRADVQSFSHCPGVGCVTPHLQSLRKEGILLDRHHTYLWCSPTRRAFLTGRFPVHVTGTQAPTCSNLTPLQFTILSEKLAAVDYEAHFIGKGTLALVFSRPPLATVTGLCRRFQATVATRQSTTCPSIAGSPGT